MFFLSNYNACSPVSYFDVPPPPIPPQKLPIPFMGKVWNIFYTKSLTMHYFIVLKWFLNFLYIDFQIHVICNI